MNFTSIEKKVKSVGERIEKAEKEHGITPTNKED